MKFTLRIQGNYYLQAYVLASSVFALIDSIQLGYYPLILFGLAPAVEGMIRAQLHAWLKDMNLGILLFALVLNVALRVISIAATLRVGKRWPLLGLASCAYTMALVAVFLPINLAWEPPAMACLAALLLAGRAKQKGNDSKRG